MKRCVVLLDGSNFHATTKKLQSNVDYTALLSHFKTWQGGELYRAYYFTALPERGGTDGNIHKMMDFIEYNGWTLVQKPMKTMTDDYGVVKKKGNMDCEIILTAVEAIPFVTDLVLFSGDGDFKELLVYAQRRGVKCHVYSSLKANMVGDELRRQADEFVELDNFLDCVER